jgi:hypothetical protein
MQALLEIYKNASEQISKDCYIDMVTVRSYNDNSIRYPG